MEVLLAEPTRSEKKTTPTGMVQRWAATNSFSNQRALRRYS
jgi:hypothetical protein